NRNRTSHPSRRSSNLSFLCGIETFAGNRATVADDDGQLRSAVNEDEAAGMKRIVRDIGRVVAHPTVQRDGKLRGGDVGGIRAGRSEETRLKSSHAKTL